MTITTAPVARESKANQPIRWKVIQRGLWIGKRDGEFAGMIESTRSGEFAAMTNLGEQLGLFPSADAAKQSFSQEG